ncbi:MAG: hypothetical protein ACLRRT_14795 [Ruthenibacterium lactatiformans]
MMTAGVEFSTDNAFARFANGVVEDLRMGAGGWSGSWKIGGVGRAGRLLARYRKT